MAAAIPALSLVLPCYNEEDSLENIVLALDQCFRRDGVALQFVLVNNGSTDRTGEVIDRLAARGLPITKVTVEVNQGYGYGILQGLQKAHGRLVGFVCADGQVDAEDVVKAYKVAERASGQVLVKVRRCFRMDGWVRKIVSTIYNSLISVLFGGLGSIDINGNPKFLSRRNLLAMRLVSRDWFLDAEIMIKAKYLDLRVIEMNVFARMREGGNTNVRPQTCWEFLGNLWRYRWGKPIREWLNESRLPADHALTNSVVKSK